MKMLQLHGKDVKVIVKKKTKNEILAEATEHYCPGGGAIVVGFDGKISTCDLLNQCRGDQICNPQLGVCCTSQFI